MDRCSLERKEVYIFDVLVVVAILVLLFQREKPRAKFIANYLSPPLEGEIRLGAKASKLLKKYEMKHTDLAGEAKGKREWVLEELKRLRFGRRDSWSNPRIVFKEARRRL